MEDCIQVMELGSEADRALVVLSHLRRPRDRVHAYIFLRRLHSSPDTDVSSPTVCGIRKSIWQHIYSDLNSPDEELAAHALRWLGVFMRHSSFGTAVTDDQTCRLLLTLQDLINNTNEQLFGSLGIWCIAVQKLKSSTLALHLKNIVGVVVRCFDNSRQSTSKYLGAFQAVTHLSKQLPSEMQDLSTMWAPPIYEQLLSSNAKVVFFAVKCLREVESILFPPSALLSKRVAEDIQQKLMLRMESMVKSEGRNALVVVQAWGWLVKLLGEQFMDGRTLVNRMLKILEFSFISTTAEVRNASQVAWNALVDVLVPSCAKLVPHSSPTQAKSQSIGDEAKNCFSMSGSELFDGLAEPSRKHLKLLMMPLLKTMECEVDTNVVNNCCFTWIYLLQRLHHLVNEPWVVDIVVIPVLETVFRLGPTSKTSSICQTVTKVVVSMMSKTTSDEATLDLQSSELSQETQPNPAVKGSNTRVQHDATIHWTPWQLERLLSQLQIVQLLWSKATEDGEYFSEDGDSSLETALKCWTFIVKGVGKAGRGIIRPSSEHISAVHLLLDFLSKVCTECPERTVKDVALRTWSLVQILITELGPLVLASSFYRKTISLGSSVVAQEQAHDADQIDTAIHPVMVTPIMIISAAWLSLVFKHPLDAAEEVVKSRVVQLLKATAGGFDVIGNFQWFACILDQLKQVDPWVHQGGSWQKSGVRHKESCAENSILLLKVWESASNCLTEHVEKLKDVPCTKGSAGDSGYQVVCNLLLFPFNYLLQHSYWEYTRKGESPVEFANCISCSDSQIEVVLKHVANAWFQLYDSVSRISSLRSGKCNAFAGIFFCEILKIMRISPITQLKSNITDQCADFLSVLISHSMTHTEISSLAMLTIIRKRRQTGYGASSLRVQFQDGTDPEDVNNIRDLLTVSGRLLNTFCRTFINLDGAFNHEVVVKILGAFSCLAQRITSQSDALLLLQALSDPMTKWLMLGIDISTSNSATRHIPPELLQGLEKAWDTLLSSLQSCHPSLVFDSTLLAVQAKSLAPAFLHAHAPIAKRTLCYWKSTYGSKTISLHYPDHLALVLSKLNLKVFSLPDQQHARLKDSKSYSSHTSARARLLTQHISGMPKRDENMTAPQLIPDNLCAEPMNHSVSFTDNGLIVSTIGPTLTKFQEKDMAMDKLISANCSQACQPDSLAFISSCIKEPNNHAVLIADVASDSVRSNSTATPSCQEGGNTLFTANKDYAQVPIDVPETAVSIFSCMPSVEKLSMTSSILAADGGNLVCKEGGRDCQEQENDKHAERAMIKQQDCLSKADLVLSKGNTFSTETAENVAVSEGQTDTTDAEQCNITSLVGGSSGNGSVHTSEVFIPENLFCSKVSPTLPQFHLSAGHPQSFHIDIAAPGVEWDGPADQNCQPAFRLPGRQKKRKFKHEVEIRRSLRYRQNCGSKSFHPTEELNSLPFSNDRGNVVRAISSSKPCHAVSADHNKDPSLANKENVSDNLPITADQVTERFGQPCVDNMVSFAEGPLGHAPVTNIEEALADKGYSDVDRSSTQVATAISSPVKDELYQLEKKLQLLLARDPALTFRQIYHLEGYERVPKTILKRLKCYFNGLKGIPSKRKIRISKCSAIPVTVCDPIMSTSEETLARLKDDIKSKYDCDPALSSRQIFRTENYSGLSRRLLKKLKSYLDDLRNTVVRSRIKEDNYVICLPALQTQETVPGPILSAGLCLTNSLGDGNYDQGQVRGVQESKTDTVLGSACEQDTSPSPVHREENSPTTVVSTLNDDSGTGYDMSADAAETELAQLKENLEVLYVTDPAITFREVFHSECYQMLPRRTLKKLKCYLEQLRMGSMLPKRKRVRGLLGSAAEEIEDIDHDLRHGDVVEPDSQGCDLVDTEKDCVLDRVPNPGENVVERTAPDLETCTTSVLPSCVDVSDGNRDDGHSNGEAARLQLALTASGIKHIAAKKQHLIDELLEYESHEAFPTRELNPKILGDGWLKPAFKTKGTYSDICQQADDTVQRITACVDEVATRAESESRFQIQKLNRGMLTGSFDVGKIPAVVLKELVTTVVDFAEFQTHEVDKETEVTATAPTKPNKRKCNRPRRIPCHDSNLDGSSIERTQPGQLDPTPSGSCRCGGLDAAVGMGIGNSILEHEGVELDMHVVLDDGCEHEEQGGDMANVIDGRKDDALHVGRPDHPKESLQKSFSEGVLTDNLTVTTDMRDKIRIAGVVTHKKRRTSARYHACSTTISQSTSGEDITAAPEKMICKATCETGTTVEVGTYLRKPTVKFSDVFAALVSSSKWKDMDKAEFLRVKSYAVALNELMDGIASTKPKRKRKRSKKRKSPCF